jgi:hypothetical protein
MVRGEVLIGVQDVCTKCTARALGRSSPVAGHLEFNSESTGAADGLDVNCLVPSPSPLYLVESWG